MKRRSLLLAIGLASICTALPILISSGTSRSSAFRSPPPSPRHPTAVEGSEPPLLRASRPPASPSVRVPEYPADVGRARPPEPCPDEFVTEIEVVTVAARSGVELAGARVELRSWPFFGSEEPTVAVDLTDASGVARLRAPLGTVEAYALHGSEEGTIRFATAGTRLVSVEPSHLRLELRQGSVLEGVVLHGRTNEPIAGATVRNDVVDSILSAPTTTDERGRFSIAPWPTDIELGIIAEAAGFGQDSARIRVDADGSWRAPARIGHPAREGDSRPFLEIRLLPERTISGFVSRAGEGAIEDCWARAEGTLLVSDRFGRDDSAAIRFEGPDAFSLEGLRPDVTHTVWVGADARAPERFVVPPGDSLVDLGAVSLAPAATVSGRVIDSLGQPISGATLCAQTGDTAGIRLTSTEGAGASARDGSPRPLSTSVETISERDGTFRIADLPAGEITLEVIIEGSAEARHTILLRRGERAVLAGPLVIDEHREILYGHVDADPAHAGALTVHLSYPGLGRISQASVDSRGNFSLWGARPQQVFALQVRHGGSPLWQGAVSLEDVPLRIRAASRD